METLKLKSRGESVIDLQVRLNLVLHCALLPDGDYGSKTRTAVLYFQSAAKLKETGEVDTKTWEMLCKAYEPLPKFVVVLDAGHGGMDPETGLYTTPAKNGKRYRHKGAVLHFGGDTFFEGVANRAVTARIEQQLRSLGILVVNAHHPYKDYWGTTDDAGELYRRGTFALPYLKRGFSGYYHSFHSNAAGDPKTQTQAEIDKIRGGIIFTTRGVTASDTLAQKYLSIWTARFGEAWVRLADEKESDRNGGRIGLGSDYEANFAVIRENEEMAAELKAAGKMSGTWEAFLEECDFFTSRDAAEWLLLESTEITRAAAAVELAQWRFAEFVKTIRKDIV